MNINELPLLELFERLRNEGFPLGIKEYQLLLQALQGGFGLPGQQDLARLCCTLWVKSAEEKRIFDYHFEQVITNNTKSFSLFLTKKETINQPSGDSTPVNPKIIRKKIAIYSLIFAIGLLICLVIFQLFNDSETRGNLPSIPKRNQNFIQEQINVLTPNTDESPNIDITNRIINNLGIISIILTGSLLIRWIIKRVNRSKVKKPSIVNSAPQNPSLIVPDAPSLTDDEVELAQVARQISLSKKTNFNESFSRRIKDFPVTRRQMKQSWRYLRRFVREGPPSELDIEATVKQIGSQGLLIKPVLVPRRVNRTELLLLLDRDGSMIPFHRLSSRIAETAILAGRLGKTNTYYFHNCPIEYLYSDPYLQQDQLIEDILPRLHSRWTVALIFSDAGAARKGFNLERVEKTAEFLEQIKKRIRRVSWLNPLPSSRWKGTTAEEIARLVPMFEVSKQGLQNSINVLRGK
jgi:uncharacterized protein with von Willebrand factor type A (vWA) domain